MEIEFGADKMKNHYIPAWDSQRIKTFNNLINILF